MKTLLFHRITHQSCCSLKHSCRWMSHFTDIRQRLQQCQAGTVELTKNTDTGIAVLTLNSPGRKNAVSGSMMVELMDHVTELSQWQEGKGLILRGADNTFCSGGDLKSLMAKLQDSQEAVNMSHFMQDTMTRLRCLPMVSLALIEGLAIGGGAELIVACDVRAMTKNAKVGFVEVKMGVTTGWAGGTYLYQLVGRRKALQLLGSSKILTSQEALDFGLVEHLLPEQPSPLEAAQTVLLENYCRGHTQLLRGVKGMLASFENSSSVAEALELERNIFAPFWKGEAHLAALGKNIKHS